MAKAKHIQFQESELYKNEAISQTNKQETK